MSKRCHPGDDDGSSKRYKGTTREFAWVRNEQRGKILDSTEKTTDKVQKTQKVTCKVLDDHEKYIGLLVETLAARIFGGKRRSKGTHDEAFAVLASISMWWLERKQRRERAGGQPARSSGAQHKDMIFANFAKQGYKILSVGDSQLERDCAIRSRQLCKVVTQTVSSSTSHPSMCWSGNSATPRTLSNFLPNIRSQKISVALPSSWPSRMAFSPKRSPPRRRHPPPPKRHPLSRRPPRRRRPSPSLSHPCRHLFCAPISRATRPVSKMPTPPQRKRRSRQTPAALRQVLNIFSVTIIRQYSNLFFCTQS